MKKQRKAGKRQRQKEIGREKAIIAQIRVRQRRERQKEQEIREEKRKQKRERNTKRKDSKARARSVRKSENATKGRGGK